MIALVVALLVSTATERFEDLTLRLSQEPVDVACAQMEVWVEQHHDRDDASRGLLWIARKRLDSHDRNAARAALQRATAGRGRFGTESLRLLSAMNIEDGRLDDAFEGASKLASAPDAVVADEGNALLHEIAHRKTRRLWLELCALFLAADVAVRAFRTKSKLWPAPFEALVAGPVLAMLVVVAALRSLPQLPIVAAFALSGTALAWVRGAHRRTHPLALRWRLLDAVLALAEAAALAYLVLESAGAVDNLILTLTAGPE